MIDVSQGIDINKTSISKNVIIVIIGIFSFNGICAMDVMTN